MTVARVIQQDRHALSERGDDFYETPACAVESLLAAERFAGSIWEPACGGGAIVNVLRAHGRDVVATDLIDRGVGEGRIDFLMEQRLLAPNIITNPPYKLADEFAAHALKLGAVKVALLLRLVFLAGQKRRLFFERSPLKRVWVFSGRLPRMHRDGWQGPKTTSSVDFAWFVWDSLSHVHPTIGWLPPSLSTDRRVVPQAEASNTDTTTNDYDEALDGLESYNEAIRECGIRHRETGELGDFFRSEKDIA